MTRESVTTAMRRALAIADRGPVTGVNPRVGCVILSPAGDLLAEGWHRGAGTPHAEVAALSALANPADAVGATAVVSLEPCNHHGRTGPCSEALIAAGIAEVVYSVDDPGEHSGGGAERLRSAGVEVTGGVLAAEGGAFLRVWLTAERAERPFVTLKWASSLDGRAAAADGTSQWITGTAARHHVHERRAASDAIIVGTGTVLADDPSLTARGEAGELTAHQPVPVVIGERAVPANARIRQHPQPLVAVGHHDLAAAMRQLFDSGIRHAFVEGGPTLASAFVAAGLVDEYLVYLAPTLLGGPRLSIGEIGVGTLADARRLRIDSVEQLGDDLVVIARPIPPHTHDTTPQTHPADARHERTT
ncbi:bifunctional diaminohydroxyphosphoribosylaminopyrimidine deaminase/5-amino-6-(5-phosphoribosylamino)uracil reductase RibD [Marisediminicola senii]|uniref:bifunctional diaminohydroxyphosphoribosylaminopyrimidine deaminase/5-amino-6-(5-phosphoribosylamino)uracil reductase RibD n=1 Tax=Marisediminicola senii TaxID=2711233 RepID=UPI0013ECC589|nr:bifunctional diaminohydroxyphosphoribosylaminopyrimidine deaminase/5-amino-6-(5-phosphoribosylamino)uracil reductase RibD [Marisediminicola senii]